MPLGDANQYDYHRVERLMPFQLMSSVSSLESCEKNTQKNLCTQKMCGKCENKTNKNEMGYHVLGLKNEMRAFS